MKLHSSRTAIAICGAVTLTALGGCERKKESKRETPSPEPEKLAVTTPARTPTPLPTPSPTPQPTPEPTPTPVPTPYVPYKALATGTIFNGISYKTKFETVNGSTATKDRNNADSYTVEVSVKVAVPKPHQNLEELSRLNENIGTVLPGLSALLPTAKVSPEFSELYRRKVTSVRSNLDRLDQLMSRHNFYDCETILELQNPKTKRKALLIQADMDVDTDGSDGDRMAAFDPGSRTYQPFTSYRWKKKTSTPNPCVPIWEKKIAENEAKTKDPKTSATEVQRLKSDTARLRVELRDMAEHSFLIGSLDPFIVLPTPMFSGKKNGFTPRIGDYCVVLAGDTFYPAIIGDAGPTSKIGEASLRLCRQINAKANGEFRPMSELKATYIVFPDSRDKDWGPPNLLQWQKRCEELLKELDDFGGTLFAWELPPPPAPVTPEPTGTPTTGTSSPAPQAPTAVPGQ